MNSYDFRALNDKEFEALAVDLLSAEYGVRIERFKPGKDGGVDGRWFATTTRESILQCKHWIQSGYDHLVRHLENSERAKVERLSPARYILATSVPLSRLNKQRIASVMAPYLVSESDILGHEDLNDILGRHADVERRHYKLWLSSSNTIALLLNNAIIGRSRAELEQIRQEAPLYVVTKDHVRAARHLADKRVLVLTGDPGIGKTTLARQLVLEHVTDGFELVVLEESISEAESVFVDDAKQLFYFDDFLGRTFLEAIKAKQDSHTLRFMMRIARDSRKRFILTSRTNILNQGAALSDLYADVHIVKNTYELKIGNLSRLDRARILYNHIWHSDLSAGFIDELYADKRYHLIINHQNYNPRLVAFVVDAGKVGALTPPNYWGFVLKTFQNPTGVWSHFFSAQLSQDDRDLIYLVVLNSGSIREVELRESFFSLPSPEPANEGLLDTRFWKAVRHTSGSVLNRNLVAGSERAIYTLYNPSIADFVQSQLVDSNLWSYYFRCIRTLAALSRLEQMRAQPFFGVARYHQVLYALNASEAKRSYPRDEYNLRLTRLLASDDSEQPEAIESIHRWLEQSIEDDLPLGDIASVLKSGIGRVDRETLLTRASELAALFEHSPVSVEYPETIAEILETVATAGATEAHKRIRAHVVSDWSDELSQHIAENNVLSSYLDPEDTGDAKEELKSFVTKQFVDMGVELTPIETEALCRMVDIAQIIADNIDVAYRDDESDESRGVRTRDQDDSQAVDDLFDRSDR